MQGDGELSAGWRLFLSLAIVLGVVGFGILLVYSWFFVAPLVLLGLVIVAGVRWALRR